MQLQFSTSRPNPEIPASSEVILEGKLEETPPITLYTNCNHYYAGHIHLPLRHFSRKENQRSRYPLSHGSHKEAAVFGEDRN